MVVLRRVCCKLVVVTQKEIQSFKLKFARFEPPAARRRCCVMVQNYGFWLAFYQSRKVDGLRGVC